MLGVNILTIPGIGILTPISNITKLYSTSIDPPNWAFSIWGLIYFELLLFSIFQFCPNFGYDKLISKTCCPFVMSCIFNGLWLIVFSLGNKSAFLGSFFIILFLLIMLMIIQSVGKIFMINNKCKIFFFDIPFSLYLGWIIFASFANLGTCLKAWGIYNSDALFFVTVIITLLINIFNLYRNNNYVTMLVYLYVASSLLVKYYYNNVLYANCLIVSGSVGILFIFLKILLDICVCKKKRKMNYYTNMETNMETQGV